MSKRTKRIKRPYRITPEQLARKQAEKRKSARLKKARRMKLAMREV